MLRFPWHQKLSGERQSLEGQPAHMTLSHQGCCHKLKSTHFSHQRSHYCPFLRLKVGSSLKSVSSSSTQFLRVLEDQSVSGRKINWLKLTRIFPTYQLGLHFFLKSNAVPFVITKWWSHILIRPECPLEFFQESATMKITQRKENTILKGKRQQYEATPFFRLMGMNSWTYSKAHPKYFFRGIFIPELFLFSD